MRIFEPIAGIEGVASGATATVKIPTQRRLHALRLFAAGTNAVPAAVWGANVIDEVFLYVNGRLIQTLTGLEIEDIVNLNTVPFVQSTDGSPLFFSEPWRASVMDEQVSAWDLFGISDMTVKVKLKTGLTGVTLSAVMEHDDGFSSINGQRVLNIVKRTPFFFNAGTSFDITALDADKPIHRIYLYPGTGVSITEVKVIVNDTQTVHELTANQNSAFLKDYGLTYTPGAGTRYPVVFDQNQQFFDALPAVRSLRVTVKSSAAGQIKAVLENHAPAYI